MKCQATFKEHCQYPKCDCDRLAELEVKLAGEYVGGMTEYWQRQKDCLTGKFITNPAHGGKVTCHTCNGFIAEGDDIPYRDHQHPDEFPKAHFHKDCYNPYEHYYGLDKPID